MHSVSLKGIGVHSGAAVTLSIHPAPENTGIIFRRADVGEEVPARIEYVQDARRSTTIGVGKVQIRTVEHLLAAMKALEVDNVFVELSSSELPIVDGSAQPFVELIDSAGVVDQQGRHTAFALNTPISWAEGEVVLVAIPSEQRRVSYTLSYPDSEALKAQFQSLPIDADTFRQQIAPARTFSLYHEVELLMDHGLIRGGSLDNAVVIKDDVYFSKEGLRFPDEMVRHKILDLIGNLSLLGIDLVAHIIAIRSGHSANCAFAAELYKTINRETVNA